MLSLYTIGFYLALPFILIRAAWKTRRTQDHLKRLGERIGIYSCDKAPSSLWLHAVSYGEAVAAEPLIKQLKITYPLDKIVVTTMTLTGAMRVQATWQKDPQICHIYLPYDIPLAINRFLKHMQPKLGIIMETELWPNLLHIAGKQKLPLLLANARLSPKSYGGYQRIAKFISPLMKSLSHIAAQSTQDAERFMGLGMSEARVSTLGNLKFDISPPQQQLAAGLELKNRLPFRHILVAASTHSNEEEQIIDVFTKLRMTLPNSLLILVPRHPERFDEVVNICVKKGHTVVRRSSKLLPDENTTIYVGDSMGELYFFYALADVAFVGGSLVPVGGHNLLEPAAVKIPIVTGPHLFNFTAISALLLEAGALHIASTQEKLHDIFCQLFQDKAYAEKAGLAGFEILAKNQGATERHLSVIRSLIELSTRHHATI